MKNYKKLSYGKLNYYLKPEYIYIPLLIADDKNITILVKKGDYVYKGDKIARKKDENKINIFSSVSGTVEDITEEINSKNQIVRSIKIKNDFKECYQTKRDEHKNINIENEEFINILKKYSIIEDNKIIYKELLKNQKKLIINAKEDDPYITSKEALIENYAEELLETVDKIAKIIKADESIILLNLESTRSIQTINNYIGTYDRIKIENNYDYDKALKINIETIYSIYNAVRYDVPPLTKIITLSGTGFKNPQNIVVKIGTKASDIIKEINGYKRFNAQKMHLIAGNALTGKAMHNDNFIIDATLEGILTLKYEEIIEKPCIKCGKCIEICPQKLNPLMLTHIKNKEKLKKLNIDKCLNCALCSYICPSRRNISLKIKEVKEKVQ